MLVDEFTHFHLSSNQAALNVIQVEGNQFFNLAFTKLLIPHDKNLTSLY
jgi:hypothetical protein